jgi:eukaryotic-like serine/threonine-protein kinase
VSSDVPTGKAAPIVGHGEHPAAGFLVGGRYRILSEIGAGAFGAVCRAEDESTGHRVAIRFFPPGLSRASEARQTVLRMGRSIVDASSTHPVLTRVLEFGEVDNGQLFAVVECVEGPRLTELTSKGKPLDVATAIRLALELGGGLETLHNMRFVHGAVRPRNIVVLDDGRLKLLDIELAGLRDAREIESVIAMKPPAEYLAPEQIFKAAVDEKADTYAFGTVLHELLCGAPPFQESTREAVLAKHLNEAPAPVRARRRDAPRSAERAVMLALDKRPESRPLLGHLLNLLWAGAHSPPPRRMRVVAITVAAAVAAVAAGAVTWGVLALRPWEPASFTPTARPAPEPAAPPQSAPPTSVIPVPEPRPSPPATPAVPPEPPRPVERAPVVVPPTSPAPGIGPRPAPAAQPPAAPSPATRPPATRAPAPASSSAPPRVDRREPPRPPATAGSSPARPATATDPNDPGAVIDWLLNPSSRP